MYESTVLKNNVKVSTIYMPAMQSVSLGIWVAVGGRHETQKQHGISHFLEHLLFKGTKKRDFRKIKEEIEGVGGLLNAFTSEELTCYLTKVPKKYSHIAIDVLSDMCLNAKIAESDVTRERTVILEEIKMYKDIPSHYAHDLMTELIWPDHPLGKQLTGTYESVAKISRKDIADYKNRYYVPCNITIIAAGPLIHSQLVKYVKQSFAKACDGVIPFCVKYDACQNLTRTNFFTKETEQTHLCLGFPAVSGLDPDRHALSLLHIILGANMSSRLFNEVREKLGLAYEIGTGVKRYKDCGAFFIHAGVENSKLQAAIAVVLKELVKIKKHDVKIEELKRAREYYTGQTLLALEDTMNYMLWCGEMLHMHNEYIKANDLIKKIQQVSSSDIKRVAEKTFIKNRINLAVVGPQKDREIAKIKEMLII